MRRRLQMYKYPPSPYVHYTPSFRARVASEPGVAVPSKSARTAGVERCGKAVSDTTCRSGDTLAFLLPWASRALPEQRETPAPFRARDCTTLRRGVGRPRDDPQSYSP